MEKNLILTVGELAQRLKVIPGTIYQQLSKGFLSKKGMDKEILEAKLKTKAKTYLIKELVANHPNQRKLKPDIVKRIEGLPIDKFNENELDDLDLFDLKMMKLRKETQKVEYQNRLQKIIISQRRGELVERSLIVSTTSSYLNLLNQEILDIGPSLGDEIYGIAKKFENPIEGRSAIVNFLNKKLSDIIVNAKQKIMKVL